MNIFVRDDHSLHRRYKNWLFNAKVGEQYIYFTGNYLVETISGRAIGELVRDDAIRGFVYLVQRKKHPYIYDYIAIKAPAQPNPRLVLGKYLVSI